MAITCPVDLDTRRLRDEIRSIYARVADDPSEALFTSQNRSEQQLDLHSSDFPTRNRIALSKVANGIGAGLVSATTDV